MGSVPFADLIVQVRHGELGLVGVALHFHQRDGRFRLAAVRVHDGVARILPALVDQLAFRPRTGVIGQVNTAVFRGIHCHPVQGPLDVLVQLTEQGQVAAPIDVAPAV